MRASTSVGDRTYVRAHARELSIRFITTIDLGLWRPSKIHSAPFFFSSFFYANSNPTFRAPIVANGSRTKVLRERARENPILTSLEQTSKRERERERDVLRSRFRRTMSATGLPVTIEFR